LTHNEFESVAAASNFVQDKLKNTRCKQFLKIVLEMDEDDRLGVSMGCITRWNTTLIQYNKQLKWKSAILSLLVLLYFNLLTLRQIQMQFLMFMKT